MNLSAILSKRIIIPLAALLAVGLFTPACGDDTGGGGSNEGGSSGTGNSGTGNSGTGNSGNTGTGGSTSCSGGYSCLNSDCACTGDNNKDMACCDPDDTACDGDSTNCDSFCGCP